MQLTPYHVKYFKNCCSELPQTFADSNPTSKYSYGTLRLVSIIDDFTFGDLTSFKIRFARLTNNDNDRAIFRETEDISFEDIACKDLSLKEISLKKVKSFLQEANMSYKISKANLASFLTSLSIYRKDKISNAGALMFASKIEKFHQKRIINVMKSTRSKAQRFYRACNYL